MNLIDPALLKWLQKSCTFPIDVLREIPGDASFRRYFRLSSGKKSYMVMDASRQMDCFEPFCAIAQALYDLGVTVPQILAKDADQGYMLISDFGDALYLNELQPDSADQLYKNALNSLALIQSCSQVPNWKLPAFDKSFMLRELDEFHHWFIQKYLKLSLSLSEQDLLQQTYTQLSTAPTQQTQVFIHRDYHSANLMVLPDQGVGVIDFQDACIGPITYDLVSLLRDCYIDWPDEKVQHWLGYYYHQLRDRGMLGDVSLQQFQVWFDWMGMQRHMKAIFIFARKYLRDHTTRYLQFLPRTLNYVVKISARYPELADFHQFMSKISLPTVEQAAIAVGAQ